MPWVGFEPTIPAFKWAKTVHDLDSMTTVIEYNNTTYENLRSSPARKIKLNIELRFYITEIRH
jgi:hypothetical protein